MERETVLGHVSGYDEDNRSRHRPGHQITDCGKRGVHQSRQGARGEVIRCVCRPRRSVNGVYVGRHALDTVHGEDGGK